MNLYIFCSEGRAAKSLMSTVQFNRHRPPSPKAPPLPDEMMSKDRETRVECSKRLSNCVTNSLSSLSLSLSLSLSQLNYEALRRCVARAPITPMPEDQWHRILSHLSPSLTSHPLSSALMAQLHSDVRSRYEDTIRKTNGDCVCVCMCVCVCVCARVHACVPVCEYAIV